jgi:long-chain acyl-CoA synthetase
MELKVLSPDQQHIAGELVCRGENVMMGYYKNEEATREAIDEEGWLHTGDMALIDERGNVFLKGRCKNMLLTASGQNIYPEEIESKLNNMPYVAESLVILNKGRLVALIYPDLSDETINHLSKEGIEALLDKSREDVNKELAAYSQLSKVVVMPEEFEKTAKKSIKRYLYQKIEV